MTTRRSLSFTTATIVAAAAVLVTLIVLLMPSSPLEFMRRQVGLGLERALPAATIEDRGGTYLFTMTQQDSDLPVGRDPCQTISYQVNPTGARPPRSSSRSGPICRSPSAGRRQRSSEPRRRLRRRRRRCLRAGRPGASLLRDRRGRARTRRSRRTRPTGLAALHLGVRHERRMSAVRPTDVGRSPLHPFPQRAQ